MHNNSSRSVAARFSAAAGTYTGHACVQRQVAERLVNMIDSPVNAGKILEIGCGSGLLTEHIAGLYPDSDILALDISPEMIQHASSALKAGNVSFVCSDIMAFSGVAGFDAVFSATSLHWIRPISTAMAKIAELMRPGGNLICSVMLDGTLGELRAAREFAAPGKTPAYRLPSKTETRNAVLSAGLRIIREKVDVIKAEYKNASLFLRAIHEQGLTGGYPSVGEKPLNRGELNRLMEFYDSTYQNGNGVYASYHAYHLTAEKM